MNAQTVIEKYLLSNHLSESVRERIDPGESLFALGVLDSLRFLQLIAFVQDEFSVTIDDDDVVSENFETLDAIAALILRKKVGSTS